MSSDKKLQEEIQGEESPFVQTEFDDGSVEFDFSEKSVKDIMQEGIPNLSEEHYVNLAEDMEEQLLNEIGGQVLERFEADKSSRAEHMSTISDGLNLLGTKIEEIDDPFPGACGAHHPLILESAVKFQAKAANELFSPKGPVKTAVVGKPDEEKEAQAQRVRNHMNYQVMTQMEEYFDETEMMLFFLPILGSAFKKTYYDAILDRPCSIYVPVDELVVNYYASNLQTAPCYTHIVERTGNDLLKDKVNGLYRDVEIRNSPSLGPEGELQLNIDETMGFSASPDDTVYTILEQYCFLDLKEDPVRDEDGIALPYVVSVEAETGTVLAIRRNWRENDALRRPICMFTHYKFVPGMGFYGLGYIHLLGNIQMSLTSAMRSLLDSGAFANLQGGFVDKRLRVRNNDGPIAPGEFREVEAGGVDLNNAIVTLPFKEPSNTLFAMYQFVEQRAQKFADSTEQVVADSTNYGPVGTTMALLEASTKFFSGVHKRLHKAQKHEFKILASINYEYLDESETFDVVGDTFDVFKEDYDGRIDVVPVSDPNLASQAQKMTLAQAIYTAMLQRPDIHDAYEVSKYYYNAIGVDEDYVDKFLPAPEQPTELDPLSDIMVAQQGKPIAAFPGQDHDSHIAVKSAFLQDPASGANPAMQNVIPLIQANIQEHMVMKFQEGIQGTLENAGVGTQGGDNPAIVAQAAQRIAQTNQRMAELEQQAPDTARNKLADAEVLRVMNEQRRLDSEIEDKLVQRMFDAMKLELDKYKTDMNIAVQQMQAANKAREEEMKTIADLLTEASKIKQAAEQKTHQRETLTLKNSPRVDK